MVSSTVQQMIAAVGAWKRIVLNMMVKLSHAGASMQMEVGKALGRARP
jgi:hypothetical protein